MQNASESKRIGWGHLLRLVIFGVIFALLFGWFLRVPLERTEDAIGSGNGSGIQFGSAQPFVGDATFS